MIRIENWVMTSKIKTVVSWVASQAQMGRSEGKLEKKIKFHKEAVWSIESKKRDKFITRKKFEDTEECRRWRSLTQTEMNDQWKELCK